MKAAVARSVRERVERVAESASDVGDLLSGAAAVLRRAVPVEGWCGFTLDPVTLVKTAGVHEAGLSPALMRRLADLEYRCGDADRFADLARGHRPAAILADRGSSVRFQEILRPTGYAHEMRLVLLDRGKAWGGFVFLREPGSPPFTEADRRFVATLSRRLARGVRHSLLRSQLGNGSLPHHPGLVLLDDAYRVVSMTPGTDALLTNLVDDGTSTAPLPVALYTLAASAAETAVPAPLSVHVPTRAGRWATVHAWRLDGPVRIAISIARSQPEATIALVLDGHGLSARERQIAELLLTGQPIARIADSLFLSPHTVRDHLKSIFAKTGVRSQHELFAALLNP